MPVTIDMMVARWSDPTARPLFKGRLIDDDGCCCAQGDVLRLCGWPDARLRSVDQEIADRAVASELGISLSHAILLRKVNDGVDGCPQDVLAHPERVLGHWAPLVLKFWHHLDKLTTAQWAVVAAGAAAGTAAAVAARNAAVVAAGTAARDAAAVAAKTAAAVAAEDVAWTAAWATNEIQGSEKLANLYFLPLFGINHPAELDE